VPIINTSNDSSGFEYAGFESLFEFEAEGISGRAVFSGGFELEAVGVIEIAGDAAFDGGLDLEATGFLNSEPNVTDDAILESEFLFEAAGAVGSEALAVFTGGLEFITPGEHSVPEVFALILSLDIIPGGTTSGNYIKLQPRLKVNGVEIPIISGTVTESENSSGTTLEVRLARVADKNALGPDAMIEFGLGTKTDGVWDEGTFETIISGAMRQSLSHSIAWGDGQPDDVVSFSAVSGATEKMMRTAETDLVIYDSSRLTLSQDGFEPIADQSGRLFQTELKPISGLKLYDLLQEILVQRCGFASYRTNLPNFRLQRVDCQMAAGLVDAIAGYIGMFEPVIFVENDTVWILDTTIALPAGFPAPKAVSVSQYRTLSKTDQRRKLDALLVTYAEDRLDYDYITTRTEQSEIIEGDLQVEIETLFREYRKFTQPFVVIRDEIYQENKTFRGVGGTVVKTSTETIQYDSRNNRTGRRKLTQELLPDLNNIDPGTRSLLDSEDIRESFTWQAHPFDTKRQYMARRTYQERALISIDEVQDQLGRPYRHKLSEVFSAGNVTLEQATSFDPTVTIIDTATPQRDGTVKIRRVQLNHQANLVAVDDDADPAGDVSLNGLASVQNRMLVFDTDNALRTTDRIETFHAGELPATVFIPLARRRLKMLRTATGPVSVKVIGYDSSLRKGMTIRATGRCETVADCIILGRTIAVSFGSIEMTLNGRPI
jgi:hypothetical protein